MKSFFQSLIPLSLLAGTGFVLADCNTDCNACNTPAKTVTCFVPRSQSFNNVIKNAGMDPDNQFLYDVGFNCSFKVNFEYDQTFDKDNLTKCLFGPAAVCVSNSTNCNDNLVINVVGTEATPPNNNMTDLVADNFFLPKNFSSTITIEPSIQNYNIHLQAYFGFDNWCDGLYFRIYAPITISTWKLDACEKVNFKGSDPAGDFAIGEIAPAPVTVSSLYSTFLSYTQGNTLPNNGQLPGATSPVTVAGPTVQPLKYTRFGGCDSNTTTQLADLRAEFGWNFLMDEDYHLGIYIAAAAPTANDCEDDCNTLLWGAKAGNGAHWELGGGITGHYTFCRSEDNRQQWDFFVDATINHMFKHTEQRTFDLKNKPLSRYVIAEKLVTPVTNGLNISGTNLTYQFGGVYAPVANFTTQNVSVSFPVQADVMAKFVYSNCGFSWAIGYDFWGQTCPDVELACNDDCNATTFAENTWALRGDAHVYGFANDVDGLAIGIQPIPATYNATTAFNIGTAFESTTGTNPANANCGVDTAATRANVTTPAGSTGLFVTSGALANAICVSNPPTFIKGTDIDICEITRGMSNSVFTELNYTWIDRECWVPYVGIGARVEFGNNTDDCTNPALASSIVPSSTANCCDTCGTCSVTKWAVWVQGGLSFN